MRNPVVALALLSFAFVAIASAEEMGGDAGRDTGTPQAIPPLIPALIEPAAKPVPRRNVDPELELPAINWRGLSRQSTLFMGMQHAFRLATEYDTRHAKGPFFEGYVNSVANLHGWSDGDPVYVNYVGHPMQGAVSGYIWVQNDRRFSTAEFGRDRRYWKSRLRAAGFAWAYSTQFEIGPVSEATVGYIQSKFPQQGFVDHVITPAVGMGWMIAEDAVDKYLVIPLERRFTNSWVRLLARGGLNPSRSLANMMRGEHPWHRDSRRGVYTSLASYELPGTRYSSTVFQESIPDVGPAPFELTASPVYKIFPGDASKGSCVGGGGTAAFRISNQWQLIADMSGCALHGLATNVTGDSLTYQIGPRWSPSEGRLRPYLQMLIGGNRVTTETVSPEAKALLETMAEEKALPATLRDKYATQEDSNAFAFSAATGLDLNLGRAAAIKVAGLEYTRTWNRPLSGIDYGNSIQLTLGVTLRMGTW